MGWRRTVCGTWLGVAVCAWGVPACADEVPVALQDTVEAAMATDFIRPQTTIWRFDSVKASYVAGERVVCGYVNYQTAGAKYLGFKQFYATIHQDAVTLSQISDPENDPSGQLAAKLRLLCGPARHLP